MKRFCLLLVTIFIYSLSSAQEYIHLTINGLERKALVMEPANKDTKEVPLIFVFHGKGGSAERICRKTSIHKKWPEAVVVYPQGLFVDGGKIYGNGWKMIDKNGKSREIAFFDKLLDTLKGIYNIDKKRIYAMGHSNGGGMTTSLWITRPEIFAAFGISCSAGGRIQTTEFNREPKPVFFVCKEDDKLVKKENMMTYIRRTTELNKCKKGKKIGEYLTLYPGRNGNDVMTHVSPGPHEFVPATADMFVSFFKSHKLH